MTDFLLDTDTASRLMEADRATTRQMRRCGGAIGLSVVSQSEMLFGAQLKPRGSKLMSRVRVFLAQIEVFDWGRSAAEHHAIIRAAAKRSGRSAGPFDLMIAAHALALGRTLVTSDQAIHALAIPGLEFADWSA